MDITMILVDHGATIVPDIKYFPDAELYMHEVPLTQNDAFSYFSLLNDKDADYFKTKESFIKYCNNFFLEKHKIFFRDSFLDNIYDTSKKCNLIQPVGCFDDIKYKQQGLENVLRYNRSINITNNILNVLVNYDNTIRFRINEIDAKLRELSNYKELKKVYKRGNKMVFLEKLMDDVFNYSGLSVDELTPSIVSDILSGLFPISTVFDKGSIYVNPYTLSKVLLNAKRSKDYKPIDKVVIVIGGPHGKFVEHFVSKKFPISNIINLIPKNTVKLYDTPELDREIKLAEENNLINY